MVKVPGYALQRVSYGELIGGQHFHHKIEWNKRYGNPLALKAQAKPKDPSQHKVVGKSFPQKIITEKVMGRAQYITDVKVEGMLHARVHAPAERRLHAGSRWTRARSRTSRARAWCARRIFLPSSPSANGMPYGQPKASRCNGRRSARRSRRWRSSTSTSAKRSPTARGVPVNKGDVDAALKGAQRVVEAEYEWPLQSHASMGPACAIAEVKAGEARLWTGSQKPHYGRDGCAKAAGLSPGQDARDLGHGARILWPQ